MTALHSRVVRLLGSAALLVVLAVVVVPSAYGAKPDRTVLPPLEPFVTPAGEGCAFDVLWQPGADELIMVTQFDDGRTVTNTNANPTLTNLASGATFLHRARYHVTDTYDPASNSVLDVVNGQIISAFLPGDQGPYGVVSYPGLLLRFTGITRETFDLDTMTISSFSLEGRVTDDVCAELAR